MYGIAIDLIMYIVIICYPQENIIEPLWVIRKQVIQHEHGHVFCTFSMLFRSCAFAHRANYLTFIVFGHCPLYVER